MSCIDFFVFVIVISVRLTSICSHETKLGAIMLHQGVKVPCLVLASLRSEHIKLAETPVNLFSTVAAKLRQPLQVRKRSVYDAFYVKLRYSYKSGSSVFLSR